MPLFSSKKKPSSSDTTPASPTASSPASESPKKEKGKSRYFVREKEQKRPKGSPRSKSFAGRSSRTSSSVDHEHPLNLHPDELRRLSTLSAMSESPVENGEGGEEKMDTPTMGETPGSFPMTNGESNGDGTPTSPLHKTPTDSPLEPEPAVDPEACKAAGNKFYKAGQYEKAIEEYTKAITASPTTSTYLSNRAAAYMSAHRYTSALEDCKLADSLDPNNAKILHRMAKIYTALGRPSEALETYDRIDPPATAKDKVAATGMRTHVAQAEESLASSTSGSMVIHALDQAEKGLGFAVPAPRKWKLMRGEAYLKMCTVNSLGDAQNVAMSLLRNNSADPEALVLRGRTLYAQGENEKAIQHFRQALNFDPEMKEAVKYLRMVQKLDRMKEEGNAHFKGGRYPKAVETYTAALEVDSGNKGTNAKLLNNRAMCYSRLKQYDNALQDCDRAVSLDPSYTKAKRTRAKALGESGDWTAAVRAYKDIAETHPEEPGIQKEVRNAELELKKSQRKDYYKILGIDKDASEPEIKKAYRKLAIVHHPDKNRDDPEAEDRFKDIQEAHETLVDPQKRERYDSGVDLMEPGEGFGGFGGGMHGGGGGVQIDPEMLFSMFGGMGGRGGGGNPFGAGGHPFGAGGGARGFPGGGFQFG